MRYARETVGASAASMFLLDTSGLFLRGVVSEWDWTRTSFPSDVASWPSVARVLADGRPRAISADDARGAEAGWFEARGIARSVCVPLKREAGAPSLGVLFFDFDHSAAPLGAAEDTLLVDMARRCVRAFERAAMPAEPAQATWLQ